MTDEEAFIRKRYEELLLVFGRAATYMPTEEGREELGNVFDGTVARAIRQHSRTIWYKNGHPEYVRKNTRKIARGASALARRARRNSLGADHIHAAADDVIRQADRTIKRLERRADGKAEKDTLKILKIFCGEEANDR